MEWKEVYIEETSIEFIDGDRGKNYPKNNEFFPEGYCLFLNAGNVTKQGFDFTNCSYITKEKDDQLRKGKLKQDDIVITTRGTVGNVALYKNVDYPNVRINSGMVIIRHGDDFDTNFLYQYFRSDYFYNQTLQYRSGSAQPQLPISTMKKLGIKYPSNIDLQRRIANILSSLDRKIELNNKINVQLEEMAQTLFKHWFVDFGPFKDGKFVESELGMIPEGWRVGTLGEMGQIVCGKTPSKAKPEYFGGSIPFVKIPDMHGMCFVSSTEDSLSNEGNLSQIKKLIPPYSIMVSCIATVGLVSINTKPSHTNQQINSIIPHDKSYLYYLYQTIRDKEEYLKNLGRGGTTTLNVNTKSFSGIKIIIPSSNVIKKYHNAVSASFSKIEYNLQENQKLASLRDTLLPKLMSGEINLEDYGRE